MISWTQIPLHLSFLGLLILITSQGCTENHVYGVDINGTKLVTYHKRAFDMINGRFFRRRSIMGSGH